MLDISFLSGLHGNLNTFKKIRQLGLDRQKTIGYALSIKTYQPFRSTTLNGTDMPLY